VQVVGVSGAGSIPRCASKHVFAPKRALAHTFPQAATEVHAGPRDGNLDAFVLNLGSAVRIHGHNTVRSHYGCMPVEDANDGDHRWEGLELWVDVRMQRGRKW